MSEESGVLAELRRRAREPRPKASLSAIVALVASLGGPAVVTPIILKAVDAVSEAAHAAKVRAESQAREQAALVQDVAAARAACGRAEVLAADAKSQADVANSRLDSWTGPRRR